MRKERHNRRDTVLWRCMLVLLSVSLSVSQTLADNCNVSTMERCEAGAEQAVCYRMDSLNSRRFYVNTQVYTGWTLFRSYCNACHIESDNNHWRHKLASDRLLIPIIKAMLSSEHSEQAYRRIFRNTVLEGQVSGENWMPTWKSNPMISAGVDDIYFYLKLRAQCKLPDLSHTRLARFPAAKPQRQLAQE